jgi:hypothetical protein
MTPKSVDGKKPPCSPGGWGNAVDMRYYDIEASWPEPERRASLENLPPPLDRFFKEATSTLDHELWTPAGMMYRKVLDEALKLLEAKHSLSGKGTLEKRIDDAYGKGAITFELMEWAHELRDLGNDVVHESEGATKAAAFHLRDYAELFLLYTVDLPAMLAARRKRVE